jgi:multiple sugar transport system substrate-binding protein
MSPSRAGVPPAPVSGLTFPRRTLLRGAALGAGGVSVSAVLAACGGGSGSNSNSSSGNTGGKTVTLGSNASDEVPRKAYAEAFKAYETKSGKTVKVNTVDHNTFQENINRYLQGNPEDVFTWFAGYRMQFFAAKGLLTEISDVWKDFTGFSDAFKAASTGADGKQYFVPYYLYPWAVFYRKSIWQQHGYTVPKTIDEYKTLAGRMKQDGLIPIAFAEKDGWPAMGTFDYLNMRMNGYDFHISLMGGKESWTDPKVRKVFDLWASILPFCQEGANGRTWQEAAQTLQQKKAGMHVLGMFVGQQFPAEDRGDLDFFPFPEVDSTVGQDSVEAPIDGFLISKKAKDVPAAKDLLKYLGTPEAEGIYLKSDPNNVATNSGADASGYSELQKKAVQIISGAKHISQFLDRDTRPDFASTVMIPALQSFVNNPKDINGLTSSIESQKKTIFASE